MASGSWRICSCDPIHALPVSGGEEQLGQANVSPGSLQTTDHLSSFSAFAPTWTSEPWTAPEACGPRSPPRCSKRQRLDPSTSGGGKWYASVRAEGWAGGHSTLQGMESFNGGHMRSLWNQVDLSSNSPVSAPWMSLAHCSAMSMSVQWDEKQHQAPRDAKVSKWAIVTEPEELLLLLLLLLYYNRKEGVPKEGRAGHQWPSLHRGRACLG
jgi:hypothetical protein